MCSNGSSNSKVLKQATVVTSVVTSSKIIKLLNRIGKVFVRYIQNKNNF